MPVDYKRYHPKWSLISRLIRFHRAKGRCECCGVRNYAVGHWEKGQWIPIGGNAEADHLGAGYGTYKEAAAYRDLHNHLLAGDGTPRLSVVLTVAHLDHDITHNRFDNLQARCQLCHLSHDRRDNAERRMYGRTGRFYNQLRLL
ncbi:hypothetical protein [Larkinella humicola]|uniref:HNH endonuclease n=1 Tax=Larkinella humicola TaxID=2607654 RepID=A0A5N1J8K4_9BACT|nr:hypothetical protein [Larkinella humicola]KAA9346312.1 hypothetical protein F0P93_29025 [Larkinella humicola]